MLIWPLQVSPRYGTGPPALPMLRAWGLLSRRGYLPLLRRAREKAHYRLGQKEYTWRFQVTRCHKVVLLPPEVLLFSSFTGHWRIFVLPVVLYRIHLLEDRAGVEPVFAGLRSVDHQQYGFGQHNEEGRWREVDNFAYPPLMCIFTIDHL